MEYFGQQAVIALISHLFFIAVSFYALQAFMIEKIVRANHVFQIRLLFILGSIALGSTVSNFFLSLSSYSKQLLYLFQ